MTTIVHHNKWLWEYALLTRYILILQSWQTFTRHPHLCRNLPEFSPEEIKDLTLDPVAEKGFAVLPVINLDNRKSTPGWVDLGLIGIKRHAVTPYSYILHDEDKICPGPYICMTWACFLELMSRRCNQFLF